MGDLLPGRAALAEPNTNTTDGMDPAVEEEGHGITGVGWRPGPAPAKNASRAERAKRETTEEARTSEEMARDDRAWMHPGAIGYVLFPHEEGDEGWYKCRLDEKVGSKWRVTWDNGDRFALTQPEDNIVREPRTSESPRKKKRKRAPEKPCPQCDKLVPAAKRRCDCGHVFKKNATSAATPAVTPERNQAEPQAPVAPAPPPALAPCRPHVEGPKSSFIAPTGPRRAPGGGGGNAAAEGTGSGAAAGGSDGSEAAGGEPADASPPPPALRETAAPAPVPAPAPAPPAAAAAPPVPEVPLEEKARCDLLKKRHVSFEGARENQQKELKLKDEELSAAEQRIEAEAAALEGKRVDLQRSVDKKRATLAQKKNLQEAAQNLYSEYKKGHEGLTRRFDTRDTSTGDKVLALHDAHEQQMREEVGKLDADLNKLVQELKKVNRNTEKNAKEALKLADDHSVVTRNLEVLALRAPPEPLDGIYWDVVSCPWKLNSKLEELFDLKQPASYIYAGTSARVDLLEGRYKTHSGKVGGVMRVILVTGHEEADKAEKAAIKQLTTYARSKGKSADVKNGSTGGEGIVPSPYHFVYIFYTPKILAA